MTVLVGDLGRRMGGLLWIQSSIEGSCEILPRWVLHTLAALGIQVGSAKFSGGDRPIRKKVCVGQA